MSAARMLGQIGLAAAGIGVFAAPSWACSCRCPENAEALLGGVPVLFRGRPVAETVAGEERRYVFEVVVVHKGEVPARATVRTPRHSAACGVTYRIGSEVLVGAFPGAGRLSVNLCTQYCIDQRRTEIDRLLAR